MGKYIAKRIGYMALVFLIVSLLMYSLYNLIPTDPARAELEAQKQSLKPAEYEQLGSLPAFRSDSQPLPMHLTGSPVFGCIHRASYGHAVTQ